MNASLASLKSVHVGFQGTGVLNDLNLDILAGDRLVVLGPSGCGKSTLLRLLVGTCSPDSGWVSVLGYELGKCKMNLLNKIRRRIGMVHQSSALISSMNVYENLALPLKEQTRKTKKEIQEIVQEKLEDVGLQDSADAMPSELSGGMKKKIAIARALVLKPELLLFDEPSAGLDPVSSSQVDELIVRKATEGGITCVIVTHELGSAFNIASRMVLLQGGCLVHDATPEDFRKSPHPGVQAFLGGTS